MDVVSSHAALFSLSECWGSGDVEGFFLGQIAAAESADTPHAHFRVLLLGVACLSLFVQANWTASVPPEALLQAAFGEACSGPSAAQACAELLNVDGEDFYPCSHRFLLVVARAFLVRTKNMLQGCASASWWSLRCAWVHQSLMSANTQTLQGVLDTSDAAALAGLPALLDTAGPHLCAAFPD